MEILAFGVIMAVWGAVCCLTGIIVGRNSNIKVGTPSASHNSESAQFNCRACCDNTPMNWNYCPVCGRKLR